MEIENVVIHRVKKEQYETSASLQLRDEILTVDPPVQKLVSSVRDVYIKKTGKTYGVFDPGGIDKFQKYTSKYLKENFTFIEYTRKAMERLKWHIKRVNLASGGYVLFVDYTENSIRFIMVLMLNDKFGTSIDPETLKVKDIIHLDLEKLHFACRINIDKWIIEDSNYITFIKGSRRKTSDVALYFIEFIGCTDVTTPKDVTKALVRIVLDYSRHKEYTEEQKKELKHKVFSYCDQKRREGKLVNLQNLSQHIDDDNPDDFFNFADNESYAISNTFEADITVLKRLKTYSYRSAKLSISFSDELLDETIEYDADNKTLTITQLPEDLMKQLEE